MREKRSILERVTDFVEIKIAPPLVKISEIRYLVSLQNTFMTMMPYMILGATAVLILNLGGLFAEGSGLNMPGVAEAIGNIVSPITPALLQLVFISINLMALMVALLNGYHLTNYYQKSNPKIVPAVGGLLSMISMLCFIDFGALSANFDWPNYVLGAPSMFAGIVVSIIAVEGYRFLINKNLVIKMPAGVPPMITAAFTSLIPVSAMVIFFAYVGRGIPDFNFLGLFADVSSKLVVGGSNWFTQFIGFFLDRILWFIGLHGSNIVGSVMTPIWESMITSNIAAFGAHEPIPFMYTAQWINNYVRISVFPIAVLLVISKSKRFRVLGRLSLPGTIFNIAEPIMYGLPIVLNPLMFVPWVLGFSATFLFNVGLSLVGLTPAMVTMTVWTMPAPLAAFIGSGFSPIALIISALNYVIIFFIFLPFFKVMERQELEKELVEESATNE